MSRLFDDLEGIAEWLQRAKGVLDLEEVLLTYNPVGVLKTLYDYVQASPEEKDTPLGDPNERDPELVRLFMDLVRTVGKRYFRYQVRGLENLPTEGPTLICGNHNGGPLPTDSLLTMVAVWDHFGEGRTLHPLTHDLLFFNEVTRKYARRLGVLRAGHKAAGRALSRGQMVLVYPGSDLDANRPFTKRHLVDLGGRKGFLRLALAHKAKIVPVASSGTHEQFLVLLRGERIAKFLGLPKALRVGVFPIVLSFPWGLTSGFFPYVPLPAQTTIAFGPPLDFSSYAGSLDAGPKGEAVLSHLYQEVEAAIQKLLTELHTDRIPFVGQRAFRK